MPIGRISPMLPPQIFRHHSATRWERRKNSIASWRSPDKPFFVAIISSFCPRTQAGINLPRQRQKAIYHSIGAHCPINTQVRDVHQTAAWCAPPVGLLAHWRTITKASERGRSWPPGTELRVLPSIQKVEEPPPSR